MEPVLHGHVALTTYAIEEEMRAAAQIAYDRMRETPCQWHGCGAVLNSLSTLQKHAALHATDNEEWVRPLFPVASCFYCPRARARGQSLLYMTDGCDGDGLPLTGANLQGTYACRWQNCSHRFSDEAKLARHVQKHATLPLPCAYEGQLPLERHERVTILSRCRGYFCCRVRCELQHA